MFGTCRTMDERARLRKLIKWQLRESMVLQRVSLDNPRESVEAGICRRNIIVISKGGIAKGGTSPNPSITQLWWRPSAGFMRPGYCQFRPTKISQETFLDFKSRHATNTLSEHEGKPKGHFGGPTETVRFNIAGFEVKHLLARTPNN